MCRYGDDYDWYVDSEAVVTLDHDERCEDCGRTVPAGEPIVNFLHAPDEYLREEAGTVFCAGRPEHLGADLKGQPRGYLNEGDPVIVLGRWDEEDDVLRYDAFEALGFIVDELNAYDLEHPEPMSSYSCRHCRTANRWLEDVCRQDVVLVTCVDLDEHYYEYPAADLGPDFLTMWRLSTQKWRSKLTGQLIPVHVIERLARDAVTYAVRVSKLAEHARA